MTITAWGSSKTIEANLGSGFNSGIAAVRIAQARSTVNTPFAVGAAVAARRVRSQSAGKTPYPGRKGLRSDASIKIASHTMGCLSRLRAWIARTTVAATATRV